MGYLQFSTVIGRQKNKNGMESVPRPRVPKFGKKIGTKEKMTKKGEKESNRNRAILGKKEK